MGDETRSPNESTDEVKSRRKVLKMAGMATFLGALNMPQVSGTEVNSKSRDMHKKWKW